MVECIKVKYFKIVFYHTFPGFWLPLIYITIHTFLQICINQGVKYVVSPYESDAQISFLVGNGYASLAITEDSDLLVYGCQKVGHNISLKIIYTANRKHMLVNRCKQYGNSGLPIDQSQKNHILIKHFRISRVSNCISFEMHHLLSKQMKLAFVNLTITCVILLIIFRFWLNLIKTEMEIYFNWIRFLKGFKYQ